MKIFSSTKTFVSAAVLGLIMALCSTSYGGNPAVEPDQPSLVDERHSENAIVSPVEPAEVLSDIAPSEPTTPVATKTAARETKTASSEAEPEISDNASATEVENPAKDDPAGTLKEVVDALKAGKWLVAFGGFLFFLVWVIRSSLIFFDVEWVKGELGGNIVAFGTAFSLAIGTALSAGQPLSVGLFTAAGVTAYAAKGAWSHVQAKKQKVALAKAKLVSG